MSPWIVTVVGGALAALLAAAVLKAPTKFRRLTTSQQHVLTLGVLGLVTVLIGVVLSRLLLDDDGDVARPDSCATQNRVDLGLSGDGRWPPFPMPPVACQALVAHGDLHRRNECLVKVFPPGTPLTGLDLRGQFRLILYTGSTSFINNGIAQDQRAASQDAGKPCPFDSGSGYLS